MGIVHNKNFIEYGIAERHLVMKYCDAICWLIWLNLSLTFMTSLQSFSCLIDSFQNLSGKISLVRKYIVT